MIDINKLSKIRVGNFWADSRVITLSLDKKVTVLTGYNGAGKSTVLEIIYNTFNYLKNDNIQNGLSRPDNTYVSELLFGDKISFRMIDYLNVMSNRDKESLDKIGADLNTLLLNSKGDDLSCLIKDIANYDEELVKNNKAQEKILIKKNNGEEEGFRHRGGMINAIEQEDDFEIKFTDLPDVSLFKSGEFFCISDDADGEIEKKEIFVKEKSLDKTLFILMHKFSVFNSKYINESLFNTEKKDSVLDFLNKMIEGKERKTRKIKENVLIDEVKNFLDKIKTPLDSSGNEFIIMANKFFKKTDRKILVNSNGLLEVELSNKKKIAWFDLSKGEKTLLCLLLNTYIYRDYGILYLLDEPEQSLHIDWQEMLLESLIELAPKCKFIIATHSPSVIGRADERFYNLNYILN